MSVHFALRRSGSALVIGLIVAGGCFPLDGDGDENSYNPPPPECASAEDCAHLVAAGERCLTGHCSGGTCEVALVASSTCQCQQDSECAASGECAAASCVDYQCVEEVFAAGPSETQTPGDCVTSVCDGVSGSGVQEPDPIDVPASSACEIASCDEAGPVYVEAPDGEACSGGVCFDGSCIPCMPRNPDACGAEGPDEPANNSGTTPTAFARYDSVCAFVDESDIDWYTFFADDEDFVSDILNFDIWSSAPNIELCAYVSCQNGGSPDGGCSDKIAGPSGTQGCCWTGPPDGLSPSWDLDCTGTTEDSGTVLFSVRSIGGDACDSYVVTADY